MLETGFRVSEAGLIFTLASLVSTGLNFIVGRWLDKGTPNIIMAIISLVDGTSYLLYYLAFTVKNVACILLGAVIERLSFGLYPVYAVYEYEAYPEEFREKAYVYHNVLPLFSQAVTYPVIGYVLGVLVPTYEAMLAGLLFATIFSFITTLLPLKWLPMIKGSRPLKEEEEGEGGNIPLEFYPVALVLILLGLAYSIAPPLILVNLFKQVLGGGLFEISLYETVAAVTTVIISLPLLNVKKERGRFMVVLGLLLTGLSSLLLAFAGNIGVALVSAFLASAGYAIMDPFYMDILFSKIPEDKKGTILGGIAGIRRILTIFSPALAGFLADYLSPSTPYLMSTILTLTCIPLILYSTRLG